MGVPTSEVGYTSVMPRREDHEVRRGHVGHWINNKKKVFNNSKFTLKHLKCSYMFRSYDHPQGAYFVAC